MIQASLRAWTFGEGGVEFFRQQDSRYNYSIPRSARRVRHINLMTSRQSYSLPAHPSEVPCCRSWITPMSQFALNETYHGIRSLRQGQGCAFLIVARTPSLRRHDLGLS